MSQQLVEDICLVPDRWNLRRAAVLALLAASALLLLWWVDPHQVHVPLCGLYATTGLYCPGCGATRATHDLLHGHLRAALACNALWVLSSPLALYLVVSEGLYFVRGRRLPSGPMGKTWFWVVAALVIVTFGILRNLPWAPFVCLAPHG